jgi:deoxyribodipyrimidine photo-lyase
MSNKFKNGLFIFRRDLRIIDNNSLNFLSKLCENIYTIFIFTPEQVGSGNKYKSNNAVQFMVESLKDLSANIKKQGGQLHTFYGHNENIIANCINIWNINIVAFNLDITPYARERDDKIVKLCKKMQIYVTSDYDYYLNEPETILNGSGETYLKFTPYYETANKIKVQTPIILKKLPFKSSNSYLPNHITLEQAINKFVDKLNPNILVHGGRDNAIKQMKIAAKNIKHYANTRDEINKPTSQLGAYIKFGCVSIREVYYAFKSNKSFIRQLYWREFYSQILYKFPHILGHSLKPKYDKIKWHYNKNFFQAWCKGETGIPIVDASQRQLLSIGWTHNRCRMISSSIFTKILLLDWRLGEQFYAQHLVDYDVANNNCGWGWSSGLGTDPQPWFRYFNPYLQSKAHDYKCDYIKKWIPELRDVPIDAIHSWETEWQNYKNSNYPKPIINYAEQKEKSIKMYKEVF